MKIKLTTLLFGLLLAVGWTSNVFAQSATYKAEDIKNWTYTWEDASGTTQTSKYIDEVTDPYQMYGLLRWIYMDKRFPGPTYSAYDKNGNRERKVYYGGMDGGWEIPGTIIGTPPTTTTTTRQITFNQANDYGTTSVTKDGVTISTTSGVLASGTTNYRFYAGSTATISTNSGKITRIEFTGVRNYAVSNWTTVSTGSLATSGNNGTWTGNASSISFTAGSQVRCSQIVVTVETTTTTGGPQAIGDITITGTNNYARIYSITVTSGGTTLFSWDKATDGTAGATSTGHWPLGMRLTSWRANTDNPYIIFSDDLVPITLFGWLFTGKNNVTVTVHASSGSTANTASLIVNGESKTFNSTTAQDYTWTINAKSFNGPVEYQADQYKPNEEGYTALVVKLKNNLTLEEEDDEFDASLYNTKEEIIQYFSKNVRSIQLLTDGLRINEGDNPGTIFNCPGESDYNRFFFLGKGQARQKADVVRTMQIYEEHLLGESVPFRQMFEQFSPTGGHKGDDVKDFYSKMMKGQIFPVVHDCLSVIQNQHEFSMSGHDGTTAYAMPGMNFFIPDYRLKYWEDDFHYVTYTVSASGDTTYTDHGYFHVDGRIMNPHQTVSSDGDVTLNRSLMFKNPQNLAVWYAQYDTAHHAPVTGIYLLHLQAEANKVDGYSEPNNRYYNVDLDWRSSLNEMSGVGVKQTYIIYQVVTDPETGVRTRVPIDTVEDCSDFRPHLRLDTLYEQQAHSYTLTYIIEGSPVDSDHPEFIAWSNEVKVIIPGYDDFMVLKLHHYESDFEIREVGDEDYNAENGTYDEKNYYRNYLQPENDFANGISAESILGGYDSFMLYRSYTVDGVQVNEAVAKLKFAVDEQGKVRYKISYVDDHENYHAPNFDNTELVNIINQLLNNQ